MSYRLRIIAFPTVLALIFLSGGCVTTEKKGTPVKEYQANQPVVPPEELEDRKSRSEEERTREEA